VETPLELGEGSRDGWGGSVRKSELDLVKFPDWQFLTLKEVASLLKVSYRQVRRWVSEDGLRVYNFGRRCLRVRSGDLRKWLKKRAEKRGRKRKN